MGLLSSVFKLIKAIFKKLLDLIKKIFSKLWFLLLIVAVIWFAPAILGYLTSIGAPGFLTSAFTSISTLTPYVVSAGQWLASNATALVSKGWTAYKSLEWQSQLSLAVGAAALIAPEETAAVIGDAAELVGDIAGDVLGSFGSAFFSSPAGIAALALGLYFLFGRSNNERRTT